MHLGIQSNVCGLKSAQNKTRTGSTELKSLVDRLYRFSWNSETSLEILMSREYRVLTLDTGASTIETKGQHIICL